MENFRCDYFWYRQYFLGKIHTTINQNNGTDYQQKDVYIRFEREIPTNSQENAQIELTDAQKQQVQINTLLNLANTLDQETIVQNICEVLDLDYENLKNKLPVNEEQNTLDAQNTLNNLVGMS